MGNKNRKKWSLSEKLEVLSHYQKEGVTRTSREYGVSGTMIYKWQRAFESYTMNSVFLFCFFFPGIQSSIDS